MYTITTPAAQGSGVVVAIFPEKNGGVVGGTGFWTTPFARALDASVSVPLFRGDVTLRGGRAGLSLSLSSTAVDTVDVTIYLVFTNDNPDLTRLSTPQSLGWDPEVTADFATRTGKVLLRRHALLTSLNTSMMMEHRLRIRKVDEVRHSTGGKQFIWVVHAVNLTSATAVVLQGNAFSNLSFSADAIGTT